jgi:hypothetical protein
LMGQATGLSFSLGSRHSPGPNNLSAP